VVQAAGVEEETVDCRDSWRTCPTLCEKSIDYDEYLKWVFKIFIQKRSS